MFLLRRKQRLVLIENIFSAACIPCPYAFLSIKNTVHNLATNQYFVTKYLLKDTIYQEHRQIIKTFNWNTLNPKLCKNNSNNWHTITKRKSKTP